MSLFLQLPVEIISQIFSNCSSPENITQTCHTFASIAYSTPSLWSTIQLGPAVSGAADHIRTRIQLAGTSPLNVSIGPITRNANVSVINDIGAVLSVVNRQINQLEVIAETTPLAKQFLFIVYPLDPNPTPFPGLCALRVQLTVPGQLAIWSPLPQLDGFLESTAFKFSMLESLTIPSHVDCIPVPPAGRSSFDRLRTLIIDGSIADVVGRSTILIANLLHNTPLLETLWFKSSVTSHSAEVVDASTLITPKGSKIVPIPVLLPYLTRLAISVPGAGSDLLHCIEAPGLHNLHIDGARTRAYGQQMSNVSWSHIEIRQVQRALKRLATRSPGLRRLAVTSVYLTRQVWSWLLLGSVDGPPFPLLGSLALHDLEPRSGEIRCGFDDALLMEYALQPGLSLRRFRLRRCTLDLGGAAVLQLFESVIVKAHEKQNEFVLEIDKSCQGIMEDHLNALSKNGVKTLFRCEEPNDGEWWTPGYNIDASDSYAY